MGDGKLPALLGAKVILPVGIQGEGHIVSRGAVSGDLLGDGAVQDLGAGKAQGSVYKVFLVVDNKQQLFHRDTSHKKRFDPGSHYIPFCRE